MLKAIIFDFNGVILNDEPLHFEAMRDAVAELGILLTPEDYWNKYLPFDDRECLETVCRDHSFQLNEAMRRESLERKARNYQQLIRGGFPLFPGVTQFIQDAAGRYPLALASGARRSEIESALDAVGLKHYFTVIVAAEDFVLGKPNPESFLLALEWLNATRDTPPILPGECLVIEDSVGGVRGARAAGMACMAVTSSYPREALQAANRVVDSLEDISLDSLNDLIPESSAATPRSGGAG